MEDIIDQGSTGSKQVPQAVKTLGILSIIGSSLWGLIFLIALFWFMSNTSGLGSLFPGMGDILAVVYGIMVLFILMNVLGIMGAVKMMGGKKSGFILYAVPTGIWAALLLYASINAAEGGNPMLLVISAVASIGFIAAFGMQMKNMPS